LNDKKRAAINQIAALFLTLLLKVSFYFPGFPNDSVIAGLIRNLKCRVCLRLASQRSMRRVKPYVIKLRNISCRLVSLSEVEGRFANRTMVRLRSP